MPEHPLFRPAPSSLPFVSTKIDWKQTPTAHVFRIDLPGLRKEQVKVDLENGRVLKIIGEMCVEKEDRLNNWHLIERSGGRFVRSVLLPEDSKPHETDAHMEDGVLTIKVPRSEVRNGTVHVAVH
ncbi:hypothetical protein MLD38_032619 [Melastoma candidum]|uniref:Uncharacterized protein n=1 Tax=Melastoma candidum TaxID=119954 RepID=A0ACB9M475_9MYRT|nr:hypothetical protein MLD38_032619 [Melastoma candidum]